MLPRVSWQLVKINHKQDGCCHCHTESMGLVADRVWEQGPTGAKAEKKEDLEKGKQKKSNKNSMSPPTLFPSAMLLRELIFL